MALIADRSEDTPVEGAALRWPPFVGRRRELGALRAELARTLADRGGFAAVTGEPGIGKTRLVQELSREARQLGADVLWGRCWEGGGAPPYWPWIQILRHIPAKCSPRIEALLARSGDLAAERTGVRVDDLLAEQPDEARLILFHEVTQTLRSVAAARPLLLVLDDLHTADRGSLALLQSVVQLADDTALLVVATFRDVGAAPNPDLRDLAAVLRPAPLVRLSALNETEVAAFIQGAAGLPAPTAVIDAVYRASDGNPFFLSETVQVLLAEGTLERLSEKTLSVPYGVREVIRRRLALLSDDARRALSVAAAIGRGFDLSVVGRVIGDHPAVASGIDEAVGGGLVTRGGAGSERYRFAHALTVEALRDDLPVAERAALHHRIAQAILHGSGGDVDARLPALAYHFVLAAPDGAGADAVRYSKLAGDRAMRLFAYEEAARHYETALRMLAHGPAGAATMSELLIALGDAQRRSADLAVARQTFASAAATAREGMSGDPACAPLFALAAIGYSVTQPVTGVVDSRLVGLLREAVELLGPSDSAMKACALARLAWGLYFAPDSREQRLELSRHAVEMARRLGDPATLAFTLTCRHWALWSAGNLDDRLATAGELLLVAQRSGSDEMAMTGHVARAVDHLECGEAGPMEEDIVACERLSRRLRQPRWTWYSLRLRAMEAGLRGRFAEAEGLAQDALKIGATVNHNAATAVSVAQVAVLRLLQGRLGDVEPLLTGIVSANPAVPAWRCALACVHASAQRFRQARRQLDELAIDDFRNLPPDLLWITAVSLLAEASARLHDQRRAALLYPLLLPFARRCIVVEYGIACLGSVARVLGLLAVTLGQREQAGSHFEAAIAAHERMDARPWLARTHEEYARLVLAQGTPAEQAQAERLLCAALTTFRALGMKSSLADDHLGTPPSQPADSDGDGDAVFRWTAESWEIRFAGLSFRLAPLRGLACIAQLLRRPGEEITAVDLLQAAGGRAGPSPLRRRVAVTKAVSAAYRKIGQHCPELRRYLAGTIRTGNVCGYTPDPGYPVRWRL